MVEDPRSALVAGLGLSRSDDCPEVEPIIITMRLIIALDEKFSDGLTIRFTPFGVEVHWKWDTLL